MINVSFYHFCTPEFYKSLCKLLEKIYLSGARALLITKNLEEQELLNKTLWTFASKSFIPHGSDNDLFPEQQPILISTKIENLNNANLIIFIGVDQYVDVLNFERILYIFQDHDQNELSAARDIYKRYKLNQAANLGYYRQDKDGNWTTL